MTVPRGAHALRSPYPQRMLKLLRRMWKYLVASGGSSFDQHADPKIQLEQAQESADCFEGLCPDIPSQQPIPLELPVPATLVAAVNQILDVSMPAPSHDTFRDASNLHCARSVEAGGQSLTVLDGSADDQRTQDAAHAPHPPVGLAGMQDMTPASSARIQNAN